MSKATRIKELETRLLKDPETNITVNLTDDDCITIETYNLAGILVDTKKKELPGGNDVMGISNAIRTAKGKQPFFA